MNPYSAIYGGRYGLRPFTQPRQESAFPPLPEEESEPLLSSIGGSALEGLAWIGGTLDKPGRAVRGLLSGKPREALAALPLPTDAWGITDPKDITYGTDILGLPKDTSLFSGEGLLGLGTEILLDPLTYLTFGTGAVTKLGKAAKMAGVLPKTTRGRIRGLAEGSDELMKLAGQVGKPAQELAGQPLGGVMGFGLPFGDSVVTPLGAGPGGEKFLDALGRLPGVGMAGRAAEPFMRGLAGLFDYRTQGTLSKEVQPFARAATEAFEQAQHKGPAAQIEVLRRLEDQGILPHSKLLRPLAEGVEEADLPAATREAMESLRTSSPGQFRALDDTAEGVQNIMDDMLREAQELGLNAKQLEDDFALYMPRYLTHPAKSTRGYGREARRALPLTHPSMLAREDIYRNIPGGTESINALLSDPLIKTTSMADGGIEDAAKLIRENYLKFGDEEAARMKELSRLGLTEESIAEMRHNAKLLENSIQRAEATGNTARADSLRQALDDVENVLAEREPLFMELKSLRESWQRSFQLARRIHTLDPRYAEEGLKLFGNDPTHDMMLRMTYHEKAKANANALHDLFAKYAEEGSGGPGMVSLGEAYSKVGMGTGSKANEGAINQFLQRATTSGITPDAGSVFLPAKIVDDASRMMKILQAPESLEPFVKAFDQITNLTKVALTSVWPAFHTRNFISGVFQNWVTGNFSLKSYKDAFDLHYGKVIEGASKLPTFKGMSMTDEMATRQIADLALQFGLLGKKQNVFTDILGVGEHAAQADLPRLFGPGKPQEGPLSVFLGAAGQTLSDPFKALKDPAARARVNPLNVAGVSSNVDMFGPAVAGRRVAQMVDEANRVAGFVEMLKKGYDPLAAAMESKAIHYDYSRLSQFEKQFMRRVVPFYSWIRSNTPFVVKQILERPGGKMAQSFRAGTRARGRDQGFLPNWLGQSVTVPMGEHESGRQRFLTTLGLPFEDLPGQLSVRGTLGSINPLLKAPLELITGQQFFTGRDLADLYTTTGSTLGDQVLYNSPLARFVRTSRQLADPDKDVAAQLLNLTTGARLSDVDMTMARDIAGREYIEGQLRGSPRVDMFERLWVRPENVPQLTEQEMLLMRLSTTLDQAARERRRRAEAMGMLGMR